MTAFLFILLPRFGLWLFESRRGARLANSIRIDLGNPYFRRLFSEWRGAARHVSEHFPAGVLLTHPFAPAGFGTNTRISSRTVSAT